VVSLPIINIEEDSAGRRTDDVVRIGVTPKAIAEITHLWVRHRGTGARQATVPYSRHPTSAEEPVPIGSARPASLALWLREREEPPLSFDSLEVAVTGVGRRVFRAEQEFTNYG